MAKQRGIIRIQGTLDGITFYQTKDGLIVRKAGGFKSERLKTDPCYAACRETNVEFGYCTSGSKLLKNAVHLLLPDGNGREMHNRRHQLLKEIQYLDVDHPRGKRHFMHVLNSDDARLLLRGFEFHTGFPVRRILNSNYQRTGNRIVFGEMYEEMLRFPKGATGVVFQSVLTRIDFATGVFDSKYSPKVFLNKDERIADFILETEGVPEGAGFDLLVLGVGFFQEVNGVRYEMQKGAVIV